MSGLPTYDLDRIAEFSAKRLELGYTQKELAALLSVGTTTLSHWEQYISRVDPTAFKLLMLLPKKDKSK